MIKSWIEHKLRAFFRPPWERYAAEVKKAERTKQLLEAEIEKRHQGKVLLLRKPGMMHKKINGNAVLKELANSDMESRIELDPDTVRQIRDTGRSIRQ